MWSQHHGPPPPAGPPPPGGRFQPPQQQQQQQYPNYRGSYDESDDDDDGGALGAAVNMVTSAASMFMRSAAPPPVAQPPAPLAVAVPRGPPPPITPVTSMLDSTTSGRSDQVAATNNHYASLARPASQLSPRARWQEGGVMPSSPLASSSPRVVISHTSPITKAVVAQISVPSLGHGGTPNRPPIVSSAFGASGAAAAASPAPQLPSLPTSMPPVGGPAKSFFESASPTASAGAKTSTILTSDVREVSAAAAPAIPSSKPLESTADSTTTPNLPPRHPVPIQRATPPPSPSVTRKWEPASPSTPLRSNNSQNSNHTPTGSASKTTYAAATPSPLVQRSLPTPTPRRHLRAPPPSKVTISGGSPIVTPSRSKFRLPPERKHKMAPSPTTTTTASSSKPDSDSPVVRRDVPASPARRDAPPVTPPSATEAPVVPETKETTTGPPPLPTMEHAAAGVPPTVEESLAKTEPPKDEEPVVVAVEASSSSNREEMPPKEEEPAANTIATSTITGGETNMDALAEGWQETLDPNSGQVYYYNPTTQETSWERPVASPKEPELRVEQPLSEEAAAPAFPASVGDDDDGDKENEPAGTTAQSDLPVDWVETQDPSTGQVYYYNTVTQATSWERPTVAEPPSTLDYLHEQQQQQAETSLEDTFAALNAEFGINDENGEPPVETKETEEAEPSPAYAEEPEAMRAAEEEEEEEEAAPVEMTAEEPPAPASATTTTRLPAEWQEALDPTTGGVYYFNSTTGETSWERPLVPEPPSTLELLHEQAEVDMDDTMAVLNAEFGVDEPAEQEADARANAEEASSSSSSSEEEDEEPTEEAADEDDAPDANIADDSEYDWPSSPENETPEDTTPAATREVEDEDSQVSDTMSENNTPALPSEWSEQVDPSTGNTYYYNTVTGETSWDPPRTVGAPEEGNEDDSEGQDESEQNDVAEPTPESVTEPECDAPTNGEALDLPEGWTAGEDPTTGQTYYYNHVTQETCWDRPLAPVEAAESVPTYSEQVEVEESSPPQTVKAASTSEVSVLPADWKEVVDPTSGSVYYFNEVTQETSWELPGAEERPGDDDQAVTSEGSVHDVGADPLKLEMMPESTDAPENTTTPAMEDALPENWVEVSDPSTGAVYYYNTATHETSWDRPSTLPSNVQSDDDGDTGAVDETETNEVDMTDAVPSVPEDRSYEDGVQVSDGADGPEEQVQEDSYEDVVAGTPSDSEATSLPPGWTAAIDPDSGLTFYYNEDTGETSWEIPRSPTNAGGSEQDQLHPEAEVEADAAEATTQDITSDLPAGWEETFDPDTGAKYFYNAESGETSWEKPSSTNLVEAQDDQDDIAVERGPEQPVGPSDGGAAVSPQAGRELDELPENWVEHIDQSTGEKYFFNIVTQETSWELPTGSSCTSASDGEDQPISPHQAENLGTVTETTETEDDDAPISGPGDDQQVLPEGWAALVDPTSGQTYYYNESTQETSWEIPTVEVEPESPEGGPTNPAPSEEEGNVFPSTNEPETALPLQDGWQELQDQTTGQTYYFNPFTSETSWERPPAGQDPVDGTPPEEEKPESAQASHWERLPSGDESQSESAAVDDDVDSESENLVSAVDAVDNEAEVASKSDKLPEAFNQSSTDDDLPLYVLPEFWTQAVDDDSGRTYYFNTLTQETSWTPPEGSKLDKLSDKDIVSEDDVGAVNGKEDHDEVPQGGSTLPNLEDNAGVRETLGGSEVGGFPDLADGWTAMQDSQSGQTYFYNESTGETSWEPPAPPGPEPVSESVQGTSLLPVTAENEPMDEIARVDSVLPDGWKKVEDANGTTYYYNDVTGETSWEPPTHPIGDNATSEIQEQKADGDSDVQACDAAPEQALPESWSVMEDPTTGQTYYFNEATGETSFHLPCAQEEGPEPEPGADKLPEKNSEENRGVVDDQARNSVLPSGWATMQDPQTGQSYYFNEATGETSWEVPSTNEDSPQVLVADDAPNDEVNAEGDVDSPNPILPDGWAALEDQQTGQTYYFNEATGETSWEFPTTNQDSQGLVGEATPDSAVEANGDVDSPDPILPDGWAAMEDPQTGQTYYFNEATGVTSWGVPSTIEGPPQISIGEPTTDGVVDADGDLPTLQGAEEVAPAVDEMNEVLGDVQPAVDSSLPVGWSAVQDPQTGQTYYYNDSTGETSWELPEGKDEQIPDDCSPGAQQTDGETNFKEEVPAPAENSSLPPGWEEVVDETSGEVYYYNETTGETSWELPVVVQQETTTLSASDAGKNQPTAEEGAGDDDLPDGWVEVVDPGSGDVYYVNEITNTTSWEKPSKAEGARTTHEGSGTPGTENVALPDGWVEVIDPQSGDAYFVNESTNETSWVRPITAKSNGAATPSPSGNLGQAPTSDGWVEVHQDSSAPPAIDSATAAETKGISSTDLSSGIFAAMLSTDEKKHIFPADSKGMRSWLGDFDKGRANFAISGVLSAANDSDVLAYIRFKSNTARMDILWQLIEIAAKSKGRLRSDDRILDEDSPESAIVKLLLDDSSNPVLPLASPSGAKELRKGEDEIKKGQSMAKVEAMLLQGNREEAVEEAIACHDYATALLVGSVCDNETYVRVTTAFARNAFLVGSPMHTVAMLFSGGLNVSKSGGVPVGLWGTNPTELRATWKRHLAGILSNRISGWDDIVLSLGDRLHELGEIVGAHFCYMVCGCPVSSPLKDGTRLCLLGAEHSTLTGRALITAESIEAFDRTEAYEWAKRQGNKKATLKSFQSFKIIFASHLADHGMKERATSYVKCVREDAGINGFDANQSPVTLVGILDGGAAQISALLELEKKLGCEVDHRQTSKKVTAPDAAIKGLTPSGPKAFSSFKAQIEDEEPLYAAPLDSTFLSAKSNLMDVTGYTIDTPEKSVAPPAPAMVAAASSKPPVMKAAAPSNVKVAPEEAARNPPGPTTPQSKPEPSKLASVAMTPQATPMANQKLKAAPSTAPSVMMGKKPTEQGRSSAAPSSSEKKGGWFLRKRLVKWINPDATEVSLPENEEKPYYDEVRKVWVFPGDNPDDLVKPIAPPPTMSALTPTEPTPEPSTPKDPLSALMAPPPRGLSSARRPGGAGTGRAYPGALPGMASPPGSAPPTAGGPPPTFAVFQPKPSVNDDNKLDD